MTIALLTLCVLGLGYLNYQIYKTFTEPRLLHEKLKFDKIAKFYGDYFKEKSE